jgi:O-antigen/teichoic acid export membrane protein
VATDNDRDSRGLRVATSLGIQDAGRVLRDFATYLPTQAVPALAGFFVLPILARRLFPTELGVLAIGQTLATLGWTVTASWLAAAIIREFPGHAQGNDITGFRRRLVRGVAIVAAAFAVFSALVVLASLFAAPVEENLPWILWAAGGLVLENLAVALFAASLRTRAYAITEVLARVLGIGLGTALVFEGYNVAGYLVGLAAASTTLGAVALVVGWPRRHDAPPSTSPPRIGPWLRYGVPASSAAVAVWGLNFVDRYLLALFEDAGAVGVYTIGNVIGDKAVSLPMYAFFAAASPLLMTAFERRGRDEVERLMRAYTRIVLLVGLPAIAFVAATATDLIDLLTGRPAFYDDAAPVAPLIAAGSLLYSLAAIGSIGLSVAKRTGPLVIGSVTGLVVNIVANLILIPPFGILGSAVATPIGMAAYLMTAYLYAHRYASWSFPLPTLVRATTASVLAYVAAVLSASALESSFAGIVVATIAGGAVYVSTLLVFGEREASA